MTDSYKVGIVYKRFYNNDPNILYIGSILQSLNKPRSYHYQEHKEEKLKYKNNKDYFKNYATKNKEKIKEYKKQQYQKNKEKIKEYKKQYYQKNKEKIADKGKVYREKNKANIKEIKNKHYERNKEMLLKQKNEYYYANRDEINKRLKEKITCDVCNSQLARGNYSGHIKSKKHIKNLNKE